MHEASILTGMFSVIVPAKEPSRSKQASGLVFVISNVEFVMVSLVTESWTINRNKLDEPSVSTNVESELHPSAGGLTWPSVVVPESTRIHCDDSNL